MGLVTVLPALALLNISPVPGNNPLCPSACFLFPMGKTPNRGGAGTPHPRLLPTYGFGTRRGAARTILTRGKRQGSAGHLTAASLFFVKPSFKLGCMASRGGHIQTHAQRHPHTWESS